MSVPILLAITFMADLIGRFDEGISRVSIEVEKRQMEFDDCFLEEREKKAGLIAQLTKERGDMPSLSCDNRLHAKEIQALKEQAEKTKAKHEDELIKARAESVQNTMVEYKSLKKFVDMLVTMLKPVKVWGKFKNVHTRLISGLDPIIFKVFKDDADKLLDQTNVAEEEQTDQDGADQ